MFKKKKILKYLAEIKEYSPFELLLLEWVDKVLNQRLINLGLSKIEVHIDWLIDEKIIGIQARYKKYYVDLQIYEEQFLIAVDLDEPENYIEKPLISIDDFEHEIQTILSKFN